MKHVSIEKSVYLDSVSLMRLSKKVCDAPRVKTAMVAMATDTNLLLLREGGFDVAGLGAASANDLVIAIDAQDAAALEAALSLVRSEVAGSAKPQGGDESGTYVARGLESALKQYPDINLVLISVPGRFAAYEAEKALRAGRHVMIFSDNVSLEDEQRLKEIGRDGGLLVMGPDCGTAIIAGAGLGFANSVPRGRIGLVAASGTGAQEVSSILARSGLGVSQIIGTGGRDVSDTIGGAMTKMGLSALVRDAATDVIVIVSKLPSERVAREILELADGGGKPCIVYFAGYAGEKHRGGLVFTGTLAETAVEAALAATGQVISPVPRDRRLPERLRDLRAKLPASRRFARGLYSGGTLAQEAVFMLGGALAPMHTNMKLPGTVRLEDAAVSIGHTIVDLGDDVFTRGRAHPMIDQAYRLARLEREAADPETAVILLDVVLGYGCNADPAGELVEKIEKIGTHPIFVASICGTQGDPQNYGLQRQKLEAAGVIVAETNAHACELAGAILDSER
ncbi:MAG: acyl-CoA synthetase FdrA [Candidatus Eisenbacteria bacterium]